MKVQKLDLKERADQTPPRPLVTVLYRGRQNSVAMLRNRKAETLTTEELILKAKESMRQSNLALEQFRQGMQQFRDRSVDFGSQHRHRLTLLDDVERIANLPTFKV